MTKGDRNSCIICWSYGTIWSQLTNLDTLIAEIYAKSFGEALNVYVLPTIPFNTSEEHANCKGTITVSPNVLTAMLEEIIVN